MTDPHSPQPITSAPPGDGWILGDVSDDDRPYAQRQRWAILTRCDGGWRDDEGYIWKPTRWTSLPNPQPEPSGWVNAEGTVVLHEGTIDQGKGPTVVWIVSVERPDGSDDPQREWDIHDTPSSAEDAAVKMAELLGLPAADRRGQPASNIVPFRRRDGIDKDDARP